MCSGKEEKPSSKSKASLKNPKITTNFKTQKKRPHTNVDTNNKHKKQKKNNNKKITNQIKNTDNKRNSNSNNNEVRPASASQQLSFFLKEFESANGVKLSSLELESIKETCFLELSRELGQDAEALGKQIKAAFGPSWKQALCEGQLVEGKLDPGSPAVLIISTSALRSIELLRGLRSLTGECHAVKLFSKHMKVNEQLGNDASIRQIIEGTGNAEYIYFTEWLVFFVYNDIWEMMRNKSSEVSLLNNRVNIASGTPSRIKKLIDIAALGISRLTVIVLDMHNDVKGYSLLTLPQVRDEFWDLYKKYFHQLLVQGDLRVCLFGLMPNGNEFKG